MIITAAIFEEPWYPLNVDRPFTRLEARFDYLLLKEGGIVHEGLHFRWKWAEIDTQFFIKELMAELDGFRLQVEVPPADPTIKRTAQAQAVVTLFNEIFETNIIVNEQRTRMIMARINDGKANIPPVGINQFRAVFLYKKKEWIGTEQEKYLTISTLCAAKHFLDYLEAARLDYNKKSKQLKSTTLAGSHFK